jgi:multidrug efflux system outer membrane protein
MKLRSLFGWLLPLLLAGCAVGPDHKPPTSVAPAHYKAEALGSWKEGEPLDHLSKGAWWEVFGDATLNQLQNRAYDANLELKAAVARVEQARAVARVARSELLPTSPLIRVHTPTVFASGAEFRPDYRNEFPLDLSYEIDLWGRVRRGFESARVDAQASLASFHGVARAAL